MSIPTKRIPVLSDGSAGSPRDRRPCSCLFMRGRRRRLGIPSELWTPGEGADLKTEDGASRSLRRPSPGSRREVSTPGTPADSTYKQPGDFLAGPVTRLRKDGGST